ncbi:MAG: hypothetical protein ABJN72_10045 [Sulfitobacter sp.]
MLNVVVIVVCLGAAGLLMMPRLAGAPLWRASITPLASIIGSGFLVLGPALNASYGVLAPLVMAGLCAVAYAFGGAIRFNMAHADRQAHSRRLETVSAWLLAFAYIVSVAYYLNLLGAFSATLVPQGGAYLGKVITTAVYLAIAVIGWTKGFAALERMEQVSVGIKLSVIAGMLAALMWYFGGLSTEGQLHLAAPQTSPLHGVMLAFGLLVTVQGFETSRYLGDEYGVGTRIRSMKLAQWISTVIYLLYITLFCYSFAPQDGPVDETAIIAMMGVVTPVLPALLMVAALSAQFSAAVADTNGSGGLLSELTKGRLPPRAGYLLLVGFGLMLTWAFSVFEIISYASRAFALYYGCQAIIAAGQARKNGAGGKALLFAALGVLGGLVAVFGAAVE